MIDTGLKDKILLITGANHGIGAATAIAFVREGAKVFITYFGNPPSWAVEPRGADKVIQVIHDGGGRAEKWEADLANSDNIPKLFNRVEQVLGPVDVLVNNAAVGGPPNDTFVPEKQESYNKLVELYVGGPSVPITAENHDRHFAVNSRAVGLMMAEYVRRHIEHNAIWGRIINVSTDGASCFPGEISYGASKFAMESYSRSAACELAKYGITVNIISLGPVQTGWITPEVEEKEIQVIPMGRVGRPKDVADVVIFFASNQSSWITGQKIYVGGGHVM